MGVWKLAPTLSSLVPLSKVIVRTTILLADIQYHGSTTARVSPLLALRFSKFDFDMDAYPLYPICAILATILVLIPLPWHLQAWNSGTCLFMVWTSVGCLNLAINSIVWHGNAIDFAPVWCDLCECAVCYVPLRTEWCSLATRVIVAVAVAVPTASLCINRRLYKIATSTTVSVSSEEVRICCLIDST